MFDSGVLPPPIVIDGIHLTGEEQWMLRYVVKFLELNSVPLPFRSVYTYFNQTLLPPAKRPTFFCSLQQPMRLAEKLRGKGLLRNPTATGIAGKARNLIPTPLGQSIARQLEEIENRRHQSLRPPARRVRRSRANVSHLTLSGTP